jgi:hypothetical protein
VIDVKILAIGKPPGVFVVFDNVYMYYIISLLEVNSSSKKSWPFFGGAEKRAPLGLFRGAEKQAPLALFKGAGRARKIGF